MHGSGGQAVLAVILILVTGGLLLGTVSRARDAWRGTPVTGRHGTRGARSGQGRTGRGSRGASVLGGFWEYRRQLGLVTHKARTANWLEEQREARRQRRTAADTSPPAPADAPEPPAPARAAAPGTSERPRRKTIPGVLLRLGDRPDAASGGAPASAGGADAAPSPRPRPAPAAPEPFPASDRRPAPDAGQRPPSPPQPGGTPMSTAEGAIEQAVQGLDGIRASAVAGNIRAKQRAIKACTEVFIRSATMLLMLSRSLAEPGSHYGLEITEPLAKASQYVQAAGMACSESDAAITSLAHMTVGELADSPRQAPHHSELSETGAH